MRELIPRENISLTIKIIEVYHILISFLVALFLKYVCVLLNTGVCFVEERKNISNVAKVKVQYWGECKRQEEHFAFLYLQIGNQIGKWEVNQLKSQPRKVVYETNEH